MELLRVFSAATLCALAVYIVLRLQWRPRLDTREKPICLHCGDDPAVKDSFYCGACNSVFEMTGITWVYYQQEIDQISERLK